MVNLRLAFDYYYFPGSGVLRNRAPGRRSPVGNKGDRIFINEKVISLLSMNFNPFSMSAGDPAAWENR
jgi:hypothetical protein